MTTKSNLAPRPWNSPTTGRTQTDFVLLALLFGSVGAISWAIRGTSGWNGIDGTVVPGMAWGVLWYWAARRRGIDVRGVTLWLGLGIAIGGELGYGQYVSWTRGDFYAGGRVLAVSPATGFLWFALVGVAWGALGGIALGWVLNSGVSLHQWLVRLLAPIGVAMLGRMLIQAEPAWFFPLYGAGLYAAQPDARLADAGFLLSPTFMWELWLVGAALVSAVWTFTRKTLRCPRLDHGLCVLSVAYTAFAIVWIGHWLFFPQGNLGLIGGELDDHLSRTVYTNSQNALVVAWWLGALTVAVWQGDRSTLIMGLLIGGGFGIGMPLSAIWCLGYTVAPQYIDWWKIWEMNAGFNLGILYVVALYLAMRQPDKFKCSADLGTATITACGRALASAAGVLLVWIYLYAEDGLSAGIFLGPVYAVVACWFCWRNRHQHSGVVLHEQQQRLTLMFCVFYLLFILLHGATNRLGVFLKLYDEAAVEQYAWPAARLWLFVFLATPLLAATFRTLWLLARTEQTREIPLEQVTRHIAGLVMLVGLVGALTIWPSKIGVIYAALLLIAVTALIQLDHRTPRDCT
ncbi:MAG: hypothetical protein HZB26_00750 [Candidatus Hydrogenedentes bacterium]|nr:hypothetical protein [Candidatus Hydrogenedentota bacterium]